MRLGKQTQLPCGDDEAIVADCLNGGQCYKLLTTDHTFKLFCRCKSQFGGDHCERMMMLAAEAVDLETSQVATASLMGTLVVVLLILIFFSAALLLKKLGHFNPKNPVTQVASSLDTSTTSTDDTDSSTIVSNPMDTDDTIHVPVFQKGAKKKYTTIRLHPEVPKRTPKLKLKSVHKKVLA